MGEGEGGKLKRFENLYLTIYPFVSFIILIRIIRRRKVRFKIIIFPFFRWSRGGRKRGEGGGKEGNDDDENISRQIRLTKSFPNFSTSKTFFFFSLCQFSTFGKSKKKLI